MTKIKVGVIVPEDNYKWCWGRDVRDITGVLSKSGRYEFRVYRDAASGNVRDLRAWRPSVLWSRGAASIGLTKVLSGKLRADNRQFVLISTITTGGDSLVSRLEEEKRVTRYVDWYIVQNDDALMRLMYVLKKPIDVIRKIPSSVDVGLFFPNRKSLDNVGRFKVGIAGRMSLPRWVWLKGYDLVKNACALAGLEVSCADRIKYEDMPEFYSELGCLVVASHSEGCSNVAMEAMACGVPVISTKVGYHGDMCVDRENILFTGRTVSDIYKNVILLLTDDKLRDRLSYNGVQFAQEHSVQKVSEQYDKLFKDVCNGLNSKGEKRDGAVQ